jgi:hypothetical protein
MKKLFYRVPFLFLLFLSNYMVHSQNFGSCATTEFEEFQDSQLVGCSYSSSTWLDYRTPGHWIPNSSTPLKTILVNYIVCRNDSGQNGWQDTPGFRQEVNLMFTKINERYSNSQPKGYSLTCEPQYNHVSDTKIRFELNEIIFIDNTTFNLSIWGDNIQQYVLSNYPSASNAMNHIFTQPPPESTDYWGYYTPTISNNSAYVHTMYSMFAPEFVVWADHIDHIAHEYGHAVGLHHMYNSEKRCINHYDFLDDVFGLCKEPSCNSCSAPIGCNGDYICYLTKDCFWLTQNTPIPLMAGYGPGFYISPKSAGRMHRALSLYGSSFVVNNMPMHKYVKEKQPSQTNLYISSHEMWDFPIKLYQNIEILPGYSLEIKCEVKMPENAKIIIKQGAKLVVDGGTLKNASTGQWQGIEVWGTTNQHQYPINGVYAQGIVELKNGAVIENAANGITNWKPDDWNSIGGIIKAEGVTFKNCRRGVEFMKYRNFHPTSGYEMDNVSYFKNCSYIVDDYYPANASPFYTGVSMWSVRGVKFSGCDFLNNRSVAGTGYGIFSLDAGYNVSAICNSQTTPCPEVYLDKSYFKGFLYGIQASNSETSYTINVQNSKFTDNGYGIEMRSINNAVILKNRFEMAQASNCPNYGYGLNLISCTGYAIEENTFVGGNIPPTNSYSGIEITNSGAAYNEVYKNTFQNVTVGNLADLQNGSDKILPPTGLTYLCNTNTGNKYDFYVTNKLESWISPYQRSGTATAAANSFSTNAIMNFDNGGKSKVFYFHTAGGAPYSYYGVQLVLTSNTNTCPSHYGGGSENLVSLNQSQIDAKELQFADAFSAYNNVNALYETLKDGGNTANIVEDIETSIPSEMWELRAKLLGDSPHLSQKALEEAALKTDVLPESVLFEILSANPDEMRDEQFLSFLQTKENPLPEYMIDLLRQIAGNTSYKTVLQEQLNMFDNQKSSAASDILRSKLHDTVVDQSGIINWFDNKGDLLSRYQIVDMYLQSGNSGAAQAMLTLIPALHQFSSKDTAEYQKFAELKTLQINLANTGRNLSMLNTTEKEQLIAIADFGHGIASTQAKGILEFWEGIPYCNCIRYNDELKHAAVKPGTQPSLPVDAIISANPNPATTWIAFDYKLPDTYASANLSIFDNSGRLIDNVLLTGNQGQRVLNTSSYASGTYVYKCDQINTISGKFIIK